MTELERSAEPEWVPVLREFARASGHELRNALNALVVNLEVVRSRPDAVDDSVRLFVQQAVDQAEESVRLAEGTISLLNTVVRAIDATGSLNAEAVDQGGVRLGAEVIFSIPERSLGTHREE